MTNLFLSYSRKDKSFVQTLHSALTDRGKSSWVDWEGIPPSAEWMKEIHAAIDSAEVFVFVISPDSVVSEVCQLELLYAVNRKKRIVPVVCRQPPVHVHEEIARRNWIFFTAEADFAKSVEALVQSIETDLGWLRLHTNLLVRAQLWLEQSKDRGSLLSGKDLQEAERWLLHSGAGGTTREVVPLQTEYIFASRKTATQRQRILLAAVTAALVVTAALAVFAWVQRNTSRSREFAAVAREQLSMDPELGALLVREAVRIHASAEAQDVLRIAALEMRKQRWLARDAGHFPEATFSTDGSAVMATATGQLSLWDSKTGRLIARRSVPTKYPSMLMPDGKTVATRVSDHDARIWDWSSEQTISEIHGKPEAIFELAPSPDGTRLASAGPGRRVSIWESATGKHMYDINSRRKKISKAVYSPDGRVIATEAYEDAVDLWESASGRALCSLPDSEKSTLAGFSPDSRSLARVAASRLMCGPYPNAG